MIMQQFHFEKSSIEGVMLIEPFIMKDNRGLFIKDFEHDVFYQNGIGDILWQEEFYSTSQKGVVRGMHFQLHKPQAKLVSCIQGRIYDVVVDLRKDSDTFKKWLAVDLSSVNHRSLFIPKGCAHGFMALENNSIMSYKCQGEYFKEYDTGILWNDPDIDISWPLNKFDKIILNEKDKNAMSLQYFIDSYGGF